MNRSSCSPRKEALAAWNAAFPAHVAAPQSSGAARQNKEAARRELGALARPVNSLIQGGPKATNADRAQMGITVRPAKGTPAQTPITRPLALVDGGQRLTHQLRLLDESTPTRRARPARVLGAEVWVKLVERGIGHQALGTGEGRGSTSSAGLVPGAQSQVPGFSFLTMTTRPRFRADFKPGEGGETAVYMARWVNTRGEKGPWSEVTTATVAA